MSTRFTPEGCIELLTGVTLAQPSIEGVSARLLFWKRRAPEVARAWEEVFRKSDMEKRLTLMYVANHVVQESVRAGSEFVEAFHKVLPPAFKHLMTHADSNTQIKLKRLVNVWRERKTWGRNALQIYLKMVQPVEGGDRPAKQQPARPHQQAPAVQPTPAGPHAELLNLLVASDHAVKRYEQVETQVSDSLTTAINMGYKATREQMDQALAGANSLIDALQKQADAHHAAQKALERALQEQIESAEGCTGNIGQLQAAVQNLKFLQRNQGGAMKGNGGAEHVAGAVEPAMPDLMGAAPPGPGSGAEGSDTLPDDLSGLADLFASVDPEQAANAISSVIDTADEGTKQEISQALTQVAGASGADQGGAMYSRAP